MIVKEKFEAKIYPELKSYVESNSKYMPLVTKALPQESKVFPIVPVKLLNERNRYNNLSYGEETYTFSIEIDVYTQDKIVDNEKISKTTICNEITDKVIDYFKNNYHVTIQVNYDTINLDTSVHRNNIRISGTLDTKYENLVIYPQ